MIGKLAAGATALVLAAGLSGCIIIDSDGGERTVVAPAADAQPAAIISPWSLLGAGAFNSGAAGGSVSRGGGGGGFAGDDFPSIDF